MGAGSPPPDSTTFALKLVELPKTACPKKAKQEDPFPPLVMMCWGWPGQSQGRRDGTWLLASSAVTPPLPPSVPG